MPLDGHGLSEFAAGHNKSRRTVPKLNAGGVGWDDVSLSCRGKDQRLAN